MSIYEDDWFGPQTGLLARAKAKAPQGGGMLAGPPLPPPRPPGLGSDQFDPLGGGETAETFLQKFQQQKQQSQQREQERFEELKRDYPYGGGYPEGVIMPSGPDTPNIRKIEQIIRQGAKPGANENMGEKPPHPMPREFVPRRQLTLEEIMKFGPGRLP